MDRLNITSTILDKLGFSQYWDDNGTSGSRTLSFSNGINFKIIEREEMDDDSEGGSANGRYIANHFYFSGQLVMPETKIKYYDLFFLHEMYECIEKEYPDCLNEFTAKCKELNMGSYIDGYLTERNKS